MPRFSNQEKEQIQKALLVEGQKLFTVYGMKKVTIDDIVKAVNIAKATFYRFYEGKEYLFFDIVEKQQREIYAILNGVLEKSAGKTDAERIKNVFFEMFQLMSQYPMLQGIDEETVMILSRKVSAQRIVQYMSQGFDAVKTIESHGIRFRYDTRVISELFHALYEAWIKLQKQPQEMQKTVIDIMLDGIISQIL